MLGVRQSISGLRKPRACWASAKNVALQVMSPCTPTNLGSYLFMGFYLTSNREKHYPKSRDNVDYMSQIGIRLRGGPGYIHS